MDAIGTINENIWTIIVETSVDNVKYIADFTSDNQMVEKSNFICSYCNQSIELWNYEKLTVKLLSNLELLTLLLLPLYTIRESYS